MKTPAGRLRIAVLFGGRSAEHDVSVLSATNVMRALDPQKYEAVPIYVTRAGQWLLSLDRLLPYPQFHRWKLFNQQLSRL